MSSTASSHVFKVSFRKQNQSYFYDSEDGTPPPRVQRNTLFSVVGASVTCHVSMPTTLLILLVQ